VTTNFDLVPIRINPGEDTTPAVVLSPGATAGPNSAARCDVDDHFGGEVSASAGMPPLPGSTPSCALDTTASPHNYIARTGACLAAPTLREWRRAMAALARMAA